MNAQPFRNASGGLIARDRPLRFAFNGRAYQGYGGDTLASALLANGVRIVGRSFKYHRPRGVFGLGAEEPNALVQLGRGARTDPNTKATEIELFEGLVAASQNCWPSVAFDFGAVAGLFAPLLPAGFYYKTFMWPRGWWMAYEAFIRRAAGMGRSPRETDPDRYVHCHAHCDVLVVGAGPAGLAAALAAGRSGARLILADDGPQPGGMLLSTNERIAGEDARHWVARTEAKLRALPEVRIISRASAFGYYDHNQLGVVERVSDHGASRLEHDPEKWAPVFGKGSCSNNKLEPRQRLWHIRAREVVLATGAHERPLVFGNNDLPGVMLASAARGYVNRYAVRPGTRAVVVTNNDSAYAAALDLAAGGVDVRTLIDVRGAVSPALAAALATAGIEHLPGHIVSHALGRRGVKAVAIASRDGGASSRAIACDLLAVSGGWNPAVHLHAQARGRPVYDPAIAAFIPGPSVQAERSAGAARGTFALAGCLAEGAAAGAAAARALGFTASPDIGVSDAPVETPDPIQAMWHGASVKGPRGKRFVDLQNDVTDADIALAVREGYRSVEHVKRYTTLGMGTDQGKTSNPTGFAQVAAALEVDIPAVGTTTYRPPYVPVALGALAGASVGRRFRPCRLTPMHDWHTAAGAAMVQAGPWLRPQCYPRAGESLEAAARRESLNVRRSVGIADVSTLGKLELFGADAVEFLERVYVNRWRSLKPERSRYGVMLREDGMVFDDGTTTRLADTHLFMTTTTAHADLVAQRLRYCHQVFWPQLDVRIVNVADQWAAVALAGPHSRAVLARMIERLDVGADAFPFMAMGTGTFADAPARVFRISFSGDLGYEIYVPASLGTALWERLLAAGAAEGIAPYGIDALNALRIEKGHVGGAEINGRTTAHDLGLDRMVKHEGDFIGRRSLSRPGLNDPARWQLVGLTPSDATSSVPAGAKILEAPPARQDRYIGEVTSTAFSPMLQMPIALALVAAGRSRHGQRLLAASPLAGQEVPVIVRSPVFFDPEGTRLHG